MVDIVASVRPAAAAMSITYTYGWNDPASWEHSLPYYGIRVPDLMIDWFTVDHTPDAQPIAREVHVQFSSCSCNQILLAKFVVPALGL